MNKRQLPQTDSILELAQFWDSHDVTDFDDELEEVAEPVFLRENVVTVSLPPKEADAIRRLAGSKGVDSSELIRNWVIERVAEGA